MKKYFIYTFIVIWIIISTFLYQNSKNIKLKQEQKLNSQVLYDFELAKELFSSKLDNIYFREFNSFIIRKTVNELSLGNENSVKVLETLLNTQFFEYKGFLSNMIYYDTKGEVLFSINKNALGENSVKPLKTLSLSNDVFFEYYDSKNKFYTKTQEIKFQGSTIGYVKQVVLFSTFMKKYLSKYPYRFLRSKEIIKLNTLSLALEALNSSDYFVIQITKDTGIFKELHNNLLPKIILSGMILFFLIYSLYIRVRKENQLKNKIKWQKAFLKKIIDTSPNPIFVKDKNKRYIMANNATANLFGLYSSDLLIGKTTKEVYEDKKALEQIDMDENHALKTKEAVYRQIQKIKDKYFKFVLIPLHNLEYPVNKEMILGFATNITTEMKKKNELASLNTKLKLDIFEEMSSRLGINEKFKKIFDNLDDAMFVCKINKKGRLSEFVDINTAGLKLIDEFELFRNEDPNRIFDHFRFRFNDINKNFELNINSYTATLSNEKKDFIVKISCHIVLIKNIYNAVIFVQNIDETIKLKKEKKQQQVLIANIFKKAKSAIAVIDRNGELIKYNQSFYGILGFKKSYFKEHSFYSIFKDSDKPGMEKEHQTLFETKKDITEEYTLVSKENSGVNVLASSTLVQDGSASTYRLFIFEDITKQKELEKEQSKNNRILAQQAKMAEMGEMLGAIAHQWRQPLNAINAAAIKLNFASSLGMSDPKEIEEKTKFIEQQSIKMSETINDFMNFFKPSKNKENFYFSDIFAKIHEFLQPQLKSRDIKLELVQKDKIKIYGFKNEFEHILLNLINNAKDAFEEYTEQNEKKIIICSAQENDHNIIKVIDNAGGIPQNILNKIFNPYFTTKEQGKGTGIGLYMTKTIIEKHFNGSINVTNNDDGAVFNIIFPKEQNEQYK